MMKLVWLGNWDSLKRFATFYEWIFKILGWLTALSALKFAYIKTGDLIFSLIYGGLVGVLNFPLFYTLLFHVHVASLQSKHPMIDRIMGRLPGALLLGAANYGVYRLVNYIVGEIVRVQTGITYKP